MDKEIFLIRHSEQLRINDTKKYNATDQIDNEKIILSVNGEKLAKKISEFKKLQNIEKLWSSNYVRALETAKYIAEKNNIEIDVDDRLNERKLGDLEQLKILWKDRDNSFTSEQLKNIHLKNTGGESNYEVSERMKSFFEDVINNVDYKRIAVISHGASIKFFLSNYCKLDEEFNLMYKNNEIIVRAPSIIRIKVKDKEIIDIKQIY